MLKHLLANLDKNNDSLLKLEHLKQNIEENEDIFKSAADKTTYLHLCRIIKNKKLIRLPENKMNALIENLKSMSNKINFDFSSKRTDVKSIYNLSSIKLAMAVKNYLHLNNDKDIKVVDYSVARRKSELTFLIGNQEEINIDTKKLGCDSYITPELLENILDRDISVLWNLDDKNKIILIDNIIEDLTSSIDNEIAQLAIKNKLTRLMGNKLDLDSIESQFMKSLIHLEQENLNDGTLKNVYSQKFYKQLIGNRDEDNKISFEILKNIKEKNSGKELAMVFFDINNFKTINDEYGHNIGDEILKHISEQLVSEIGMNGIVNRRGGDEFVVISSVDKIRTLVEKELSYNRVKENNAFFSNAIGDKNNKVDISLTCGVKKIPNELNENNCTSILHQCDIESDASGLEHKPISHYLNGSSRGVTVSDNEYNEAKIKLIKNLYDELNITKIDIWGKDKIELSEDVVAYNKEILEKEIDAMTFKNMSDTGRYLAGMDAETNEKLTKRRKEKLSLG